MEHFIDRIIDELLRVRGLDLSDYRRNILEKNLTARMVRLNLKEPEEYLARLRNDPSECDNLIDTLVIKVSSFFRNPVVFEVIAQKVLPRIIDENRSKHNRALRVWSAGCASGEEPYSVAILIHEALRDEEPGWTSHIFATDISKRALQEARAGIYPVDKFNDTKLAVLEKYFVAEASGGFKIRPFVRKMVRFTLDDVTSRDRFAPADSIFGSFNLALCRNLLIYFSTELREHVLQKLYKALAEGGYLILGDSESLSRGMRGKFIAVDKKNRIFKKA